MKKIVLLSILIVLLLIGCTVPKEKENNFQIINQKLDNSLQEIKTSFDIYDSMNNPSLLLNLNVITDSLFNKMGEKEIEVNNKVRTFQKEVEEYNQEKAQTNLDSLPEENKILINEIDSKISNRDYDPCLKKMETYREYINHSMAYDLKLSKYDDLYSLLNLDLNAEEYKKMLPKTKELKTMAQEIRVMQLQMADMNLVESDKGWLTYWDLELESLDELQKFAEFTGAPQYRNFSKSQTKQIEQTKDLTPERYINEFEIWYKENIATCFK